MVVVVVDFLDGEGNTMLAFVTIPGVPLLVLMLVLMLVVVLVWCVFRLLLIGLLSSSLNSFCLLLRRFFGCAGGVL